VFYIGEEVQTEKAKRNPTIKEVIREEVGRQFGKTITSQKGLTLNKESISLGSKRAKAQRKVQAPGEQGLIKITNNGSVSTKKREKA